MALQFLRVASSVSALQAHHTFLVFSHFLPFLLLHYTELFLRHALCFLNTCHCLFLLCLQPRNLPNSHPCLYKPYPSLLWNLHWICHAVLCVSFAILVVFLLKHWFNSFNYRELLILALVMVYISLKLCLSLLVYYLHLCHSALKMVCIQLYFFHWKERKNHIVINKLYPLRYH